MNVDLADVKGQEHAKRAIEVAASGNHSIKLTGPSGSGKSLLARALHGILPTLSAQESDELTETFQAAGLLPEATMSITRRPFCAPLRSTSKTDLIGNAKRVGMVRLAEHGVLLLDEAPEFGSSLCDLLQAFSLADLRSDVLGEAEKPAFLNNTLLVLTQQPCLCGWHGDAERQCSCSPGAIARYQMRVPNALRERIEINILVPRVNYEKLSSERAGEPSYNVRERVQEARERQYARLGKLNTVMTLAEIRAYCVLDAGCQNLMKSAMRQLQMTARTYHNVLKRSRTIADLAGTKAIGPAHLAEALQYNNR